MDFLLEQVNINFDNNTQSVLFFVSGSLMVFCFMLKGLVLYFLGNQVIEDFVEVRPVAIKLFAIQSFMAGFSFFTFSIGAEFLFLCNLFSIINIITVIPYTLFFIGFLITESSSRFLDQRRQKWAKTRQNGSK